MSTAPLLQRIKFGLVNRWWAARSKREQKLLRIAGIITSVALLWWLGLQPALESIARSKQLLPRLHSESALIDALVLEAQAVQRTQVRRLDASDFEHALTASLQRVGLPANVSQASINQWEIMLADADAVVLMDWLGQSRGVLPLTVESIALTRSRQAGRDRPGRVDGRIVLADAPEGRP